MTHPQIRVTPVADVAIDKSEARIRQMFGAIAPVYDQLNHLLSMNVDRYWRYRTTKLAPPEAEGPILDLCTGTGDLALGYYKASKGTVPIIGADFCAPLLRIARRKCQTVSRTGSNGIRLVQADAQRLPFPSDYFQMVCVAFGLRNVTDMDRGLAEMTRVTRPGGRVVILEFSKPRSSLLNRFYQWYFQYVLPLVGQALSRSKEGAYQYLPASVLDFPDGEALAAKLRRHGLVDVTWQPFTFGIATLYVGRKTRGAL